MPLNQESMCAGRGAAFGAAPSSATLTESLTRHRPALVRYARRHLLGTGIEAEDVVQDVHERMLVAERRTTPPAEHLPYLLRAVRNRCIDLLKRRMPSDDFEEHEVVVARHDPAEVLLAQEELSSILEDLARLPAAQREALMAQVLGAPSSDGAVGGVRGGTASRALVFRARRNLALYRVARETPCHEIQAALYASEERGVRRSELVRRHVSVCPACRARLAERSARRGLSALLGPVAGWFATIGGGTAKTLAAAGALTAAAVLPGTLPIGPAMPAHHNSAPHVSASRPSTRQRSATSDGANALSRSSVQSGSTVFAPARGVVPAVAVVRSRRPHVARAAHHAELRIKITHGATAELSRRAELADLARPEVHKALLRSTSVDERRAMTPRAQQTAAYGELRKKKVASARGAPASSAQPANSPPPAAAPPAPVGAEAAPAAPAASAPEDAQAAPAAPVAPAPAAPAPVDTQAAPATPAPVDDALAPATTTAPATEQPDGAAAAPAG